MSIVFHTEKAAHTDVLIIPVLQKEDKPDQLAAIAEWLALDASTLADDFKAGAKETLLVYPKNAMVKKAFLVGIGKKTTFPEVSAAIRSFAHKQKDKLGKTATFDIRFIADDANRETVASAIAHGCELAMYNLALYKTDEKSKKSPDLAHVHIHDEGSPMPLAVLAKAQTIAQTQKRIFDLVNAGANHKTPEDLALWAKHSGKEYGYDVKLLGKKDCEKEGLHALLAVGQGSTVEPVCIIMEYAPKGHANVPVVGIVGKGVTFDTGGISLKDPANMFMMKSDMAGGAAVMGMMELAAKLKLPVRLIGIVPATENCIGSDAFKPSDVISSYSGKTIEIIDTDAEGRLILADGLAYMKKNFSPDYMIDLATLTGNVILALGYHAAGLLTTNDDLAQKLLKAGEVSGERLWRLPLWEQYADEMKSDVADIKNLATRPVAGAITATKFLEAFTDKHPAWAHLDIAGVAFADSEFGAQRSSTAFGIRLLTEFIESLA